MRGKGGVGKREVLRDGIQNCKVVCGLMKKMMMEGKRGK